MQSEKTPDGLYKMAQLVRANKALYDVTTAFKVPAISGKDSMKNDSVRGGRKISIPPTVLFSTIGKITDIGRAVTMYFKNAGDSIYIIGLTKDELGGSEYFRLLARQQGTPAAYGGRVPKLDLEGALSIYRAMNEANARGLLRSSHDLSLVPCDSSLEDEARLFAESNSRFVITCAPGDEAAVESLFRQVPCARVGSVSEEPRIRIHGEKGRRLLDVDIEALRRAFKETLYGV